MEYHLVTKLIRGQRKKSLLLSGSECKQLQILIHSKHTEHKRMILIRLVQILVILVDDY